jgi:hypothetical protein
MTQILQLVVCVMTPCSSLVDCRHFGGKIKQFVTLYNYNISYRPGGKRQLPKLVVFKLKKRCFKTNLSFK